MSSVFKTLIIIITMYVLNLKHPLNRAVEVKIYRQLYLHDKKKYYIVCITNNYNNNNDLFTQAPPRIKSFISACYSMTQPVGNLVVVVVSALSFHKQVHEYLFFSGLMLANTLLLAYLSYNYKYKAFRQRLNDNDDDHGGDDDLITNQSGLQLERK
ncbi:uncharacterized protein LOC107882297 [Acyrthosiphon pisum]|uniref:Uncharacterized protein n=1 Tax=Acyrthosiphon pisum TaxID=7029 RepID=A0A8R2D187_ACYPI|nr:uncharacterized protein LOC107882297 [Acyrthosiphon pisum]|eukprot:XP_016655927.1 PREDICTED: uncharacterized protein LOC107882297 [Acyrthosiphon pisum]